MRWVLPFLALLAVVPGSAPAAGLLIPEDKTLPPLALVNHKVNVAIEDQVAITTVEQSFRNHTSRNLEATFLFPVPRGASVDKFTMWVDGKETSGELLDAKKARQVYTDIVRRTQDPGLLEYLGNDLMRLRVFPIPPHKDQKVKLSFKSIAHKDAGVVEYVYPLKTDGKSTHTLEEFSVRISLKSQTPIQNPYSPTHAITVVRKNDREATIEFSRTQAMLDKDFQLFYGTGAGDIGLTPLLYKPIASEDGYAMLLVSPQVEAAKVRMPRDLVLVLDTSSSMSVEKMRQAKKALRFCLAQLDEKDRFGIVKFSTSVTRFRDGLVAANKDYLERANTWVDDLRTSGGTAIWPALDEALQMRPNDPAGPFTVVFFTDGQATVDETNPDKIVKNVVAKNSGNTRIFTLGVGDDVNAAMLDQLADATRAVSTYVRPAEDIETKVASLYGKISNPVMTDLRLATGDAVNMHEMYPPKLPDLFQGTQLVVIARYSGSGHTALRLTGMVGGERKEFVYDLNFPARTESDAGKDFVEPLWARRKVGFLLDQIRANGERKELIDELTALAKRYGIATPYTSFLVVPDGPMPVIPSYRPPIGRPRPGPSVPGGPIFGLAPPGLAPTGGFGGAGGKPIPVDAFAREQAKGDAGALASNRGLMYEREIKGAEGRLADEKDAVKRVVLAKELQTYRDKKRTHDDANAAFKGGRTGYQTGKLGVDLAENSCALRNQERLTMTANRRVNGRQVLEVGGVWIDDGFKADTKTVVVKAQSDAYFQILEKHAGMKDVFRLGNHVVWVAPSGMALVLDLNDGKERLADAEIDALFAKK
ncbi:MAG TPA: VIT and VWA domain-containing protein [Urbifossiella sp.]|nr:VIT and VWA domain-containing protein [Urbifossiella sp.]